MRAVAWLGAGFVALVLALAVLAFGWLTFSESEDERRDRRLSTLGR
jgi:hypothetical protein